MSSGRWLRPDPIAPTSSRYHAGMALFGKSKVKLTDYAACAG